MEHRQLFTSAAIMTIAFWLPTTQPVAQASNDNVTAVELKHDRTVIYPQRMQLNGNETLLDIIQAYRGVLVAGYDNMLDGFRLRLENDNLHGDVRTLLSYIRAVDVEKVQIVDNPGVQIGTTGLGGVIDINLLKRTGTYGVAGIEGTSSGPSAIAGDGAYNILPSAMVRHSTEKTDITGLVDFGHGESNGTVNDKETVHLNLLSSLTGRDRQVFSASQQYGAVETPLQTSRNRTAYGSFVNIHSFNDKGLELLTQVIYIYNSSPLSSYVPQLDRNIGVTSKKHTPIGLAELYTPLPVKGMKLMAGYEFDYDRLSYKVDMQGAMPEGIPAIPTEGIFSITNHNIYAELTYEIPHWSFSVGGRSIFYRYHTDDHLKPAKTRHDLRNLWRVSAICCPSDNHQLQLSYNRKFVNPVYAEYNVADIVEQGQYIAGLEIDDERFAETKIDQVQLNYNTKAGKVMLQSGATYYHLRGFVKTTNIPVQWVQSDIWRAQAAAYMCNSLYSLCAGMEFTTSSYRVDKQGEKTHSTFAVFNLSPTLFLPCHWQLRAKTVFFTKKATARIAADNDVYASLQLNKQLGRHIDLYAQWHDIFYGSHSYIMGGIKARL